MKRKCHTCGAPEKAGTRLRVLFYRVLGCGFALVLCPRHFDRWQGVQRAWSFCPMPREIRS